MCLPTPICASLPINLDHRWQRKKTQIPKPVNLQLQCRLPFYQQRETILRFNGQKWIRILRHSAKPRTNVESCNMERVPTHLLNSPKSFLNATRSPPTRLISRMAFISFILG